MDYLPTFARAKASLLNNEFKSHYSNSLKWAFESYPRSALNRNFLPGTHVGVGLDKRSAYPATLYDLDQVPTQSGTLSAGTPYATVAYLLQGGPSMRG
jgi:hypothetical protein